MKAWVARRNWWKIGFFVMLFLFEGAREIAVLSNSHGLETATIATVTSVPGLTVAEGQWKRIDSGGDLAPDVVRIQCSAERNECLMADNLVTSFDDYVTPPTINRYDATFTPDAVTFVDDNPSCVIYNYRIDLKLNKVFSVREKKPHPFEAFAKDCQPLEKRIEMTLGNSYDKLTDHSAGHFLPLFRIIGWVTGWGRNNS